MKIGDYVTDSRSLEKIIEMLSEKGVISKDICVIISVPDIQKHGKMGLLLMKQLEPFIKLMEYKIE